MSNARPSILIADDIPANHMDFFKTCNDTLGHLQGDDGIRQVAQGMAGPFQRPGDLVARYGGDESVGVLAETDAAGGRKVAERIQEAFGTILLTGCF